MRIFFPFLHAKDLQRFLLIMRTRRSSYGEWRFCLGTGHPFGKGVFRLYGEYPFSLWRAPPLRRRLCCRSLGHVPGRSSGQRPRPPLACMTAEGADSVSSHDARQELLGGGVGVGRTLPFQCGATALIGPIPPGAATGPSFSCLVFSCLLFIYSHRC